MAYTLLYFAQLDI